MDMLCWDVLSQCLPKDQSWGLMNLKKLLWFGSFLLLFFTVEARGRCLLTGCVHGFLRDTGCNFGCSWMNGFCWLLVWLSVAYPLGWMRISMYCRRSSRRPERSSYCKTLPYTFYPGIRVFSVHWYRRDTLIYLNLFKQDKCGVIESPFIRIYYYRGGKAGEGRINGRGSKANWYFGWIEIHKPSNVRLLLNCCTIIYREPTALAKMGFCYNNNNNHDNNNDDCSRVFARKQHGNHTDSSHTHSFPAPARPGLAKLQSLNEVTLWRMDQWYPSR